MACNIILTDSNAIRTTQFNTTTSYNIEDINFYISAAKAKHNQVFLVIKTNKNLYEIIELIRSKDNKVNSSNVLYKIPLNTTLRITNEQIEMNFMLIDIQTGEYTYSPCIKMHIITNSFKMAQQVYMAQQVNRQIQDLYLKIVGMYNNITELYNNRKEKEDNENSLHH